MWKICVFYKKREYKKLFRKDLFYMGRLFLILFCFLAGFSGSAAVDFPEKFMKEFVIGKAVSVYDVHDRIFCGDQLVMDMGEPHLIYMPGKIDSHLLLEKAAEIFPVQTEFPCNVLQENRMPEIFFYI